MTKRTKKEQLQKRDREILYKIYKHRMVTLQQFRMISGYGKSFTYDKVQEYVRLGVVARKYIKGNQYEINKNYQGIYIELTQSGINYLKDYGYDMPYSAKDNRNIRIDRVAPILKTNDLALTIEPYGWKYMESRDAKKQYNILNHTMFHGLLLQPDDTIHYIHYLMMQNTTYKTLEHVKNEIRNITMLRNFIITTRNIEDTANTIDIFDRSTDKLIIGGKLKIMPFQYAEMYLPISEDNKQANQQLLQKLGFELLIDMNQNQVREQYSLTNKKFDYVVRFPPLEEKKGEEFYLVNLLDNDLSKMRDVARYSQEEYKRDGRKAIILSTKQEFHKPIHEQMIFGKHLLFHFIKAKDIFRIMQEVFPDIQTPKRDLKQPGH